MAETRVKLCLYDISGGMARAMSMSLIGKQIDAIWHTSVIAYGQEYFFGGGIQKTLPYATPAGRPMEEMDYGTTEVPQWLFEEHLEGLKSEFHAGTYHLLNKNCNHFTEEALSFLTGKELPDKVSGLPREFLSTPLGQMLTPMIDQFFSRLGGQAAPV
eukprot:TRINITY_DN10723_c0_g2_i3.p1 TRINITY_DN10723_c0_g2~~TRINITY_DN10723_c0_g2_i3.p1  ORF type:complete len:158 (+),score=21.86 TRINITY_DN10723_c0_g2_i3:109-582(+)